MDAVAAAGNERDDRKEEEGFHGRRGISQPEGCGQPNGLCWRTRLPVAPAPVWRSVARRTKVVAGRGIRTSSIIGVNLRAIQKGAAAVSRLRFP